MSVSASALPDLVATTLVAARSHPVAPHNIHLNRDLSLLHIHSTNFLNNDRSFPWKRDIKIFRNGTLGLSFFLS